MNETQLDLFNPSFGDIYDDMYYDIYNMFDYDEDEDFELSGECYAAD